MKEWSSFYTPKSLAKMIINMIPDDYDPELVIDICAGSGNFLEMATNRWNAEIIAVDIHQIKKLQIKKCSKYLLDALDISNLKFISKRNKKLILANPPFGKLEQEIITFCNRHPDLQGVAIKSKRIETNMIISNMSLLMPGEIFAAILPENIFSSEKLVEFKNLFISYFEVIYLGEPQIYFSGSEVKTRIFIAKYLGHSSISKNDKFLKTKTFDEHKIFRGIDNSKIIKSLPDNANRDNYQQVVHFSNKEAILHLDCYVNFNKYDDKFILKKSDILISRVGRNSGRVFKVSSSFIGQLFSDYFYIIRGNNSLENDYELKKLELILLNKLKGLTAKYICKKDIEDALLELNTI